VRARMRTRWGMGMLGPWRWRGASTGSQFDGPAPHLYGKYSIFAQVVSAMQVVDQIRVGDRMRTVRIEEAPKS
jgi:cyclophilin family peptidyl-prolyl cis-trans isomerase